MTARIYSRYTREEALEMAFAQGMAMADDGATYHSRWIHWECEMDDLLGWRGVLEAISERSARAEFYDGLRRACADHELVRLNPFPELRMHEDCGGCEAVVYA